MRLNRFFTKRENLTIGSSILLEEEDTTHIKKVLRLSKGDKIIIFNGEKEFLAELTLVSKDAVVASIESLLRQEDFSGENRVEITLIQGLLRSGKFDFIVEKATEIGVDYIVPLEAEYSQMKADAAGKKLERWNKLALSASKQSERIRIPEITTPIKFSEISKIVDEFDKVYLLTIDRDSLKEISEVKPLSKDVNTKLKHVAVVIGPEGGFSPAEHKLAKEFGFEFVSIGKTILRAETASIVALGIVNFLYNNESNS
ncbi:MAG: 16S rRNA (uracil(1498)-N(3))-methyltransferase [Candidatus Dojkabacteria bacterium]